MTAEVASVINLLVSWGLLAIIVISDDDDESTALEIGIQLMESGIQPF